MIQERLLEIEYKKRVVRIPFHLGSYSFFGTESSPRVPNLERKGDVEQTETLTPSILRRNLQTYAL